MLAVQISAIAAVLIPSLSRMRMNKADKQACLHTTKAIVVEYCQIETKKPLIIVCCFKILE